MKSYSKLNEEKSAVSERLNKTLKSKIWKYMPTMSKNILIDKLDDIACKCNNIYHRSIKIKPNCIKQSTLFDFDHEDKYRDPNFKVCDQLRISSKM